jgi:UPF0755 protein
MPFSWKAIVAAATVTVGVIAGSILMADSGDSLKRDPGGPIVSNRLDDTVQYTVKSGATAGDVAHDLEVLGVIRSARQFESLVRLMGVGDNLSAGAHVFHLNSSTSEVVDKLLVRPGPPQIEVTFPEGIRIEEMGKILQDHGIGLADQFVFAAQNAQLPPGLADGFPPAELLPDNQRLQGYLFPDTYYVAVDSTPAELVRRMVEEMNTRFNADMRAKAAERGLTVHEVLTLASIVEREAVLDSERPIIASVFFNRLKAGDLLGADPTVQYAVSLDPDSVKEYGYWKSELTLDDLQTDSPYNTRLYPGLPPGPITNPSLASIEAVLEPADTEYFYFVADAVAGDGSHRFAVTEQEHLANIAIYGGQ